ncbi:MAG TPA: substrate-binding domain-containing protein [Acidimicrobiales bacterium]|nr:substrate-binding domain-containing protein [Acidimicrobiales bacterium]
MLRRGLLALLLVLPGCADDSPRPTVFAASSLTEAFRALDVDADFSFGSSSRLARQVAEGAPADVLATADEASMRSAGRGRPVPFATNRLVVAHRGAVREPADLPRLRVVLAAPSVPAGRYAAQALAAAGVVVQPLSLEPDVRAVAAKVRSGEADAGVVYATDAEGLQTVELGVEARYVVAALTDRGRPFVALLLGARGRRVLTEHGFGLP